VIQLALLCAVQEHVAAEAVTETEPLPPFLSTDACCGEMVNEQTRAAWLTVKACPAMVSVPVRAAPRLGATVYDAFPLPEPLAPAVIETQETVDAAVHAQLACVVTATVPEPPSAGRL
jgi:hypothetical protein